MLNNILHRLIIPSTVFAIIEYLPSRLLRGIPVNIGDFLFKTVGGYTFWFTSALVVAELLFLILLLSRNKNVWFYSGLTILIGFVCIVLSQNNLMPSGLEFWAYKRGLMAVLFMGLGGLYWKYEKVVIENKLFKPYFMLPLLCVYVVIMLVFKANQGVISTFKITPVGVGTSVISIILLVALCRILPRNKALTFIGQNSIGFYFMSGSLPIILSMIFHHILPGTHLIVMLLVFVLSVSISYAIVWLIVRYMPWIFDFRIIKKNG